MARGWVAGQDALQFDPNAGLSASNGLSLFFCQLLIILSLCFLVGTAFKFLGQPRVVGELLAGVILGPTAFGNIPGFSATIEPQNAAPLLSITANIGLVFFILMVGLETDTETIKRYARQVALIALPGMAIPFAISVGLAKFIYEHSTDQSQAFTTFFLFVSTVMAVTSLSVLSRVLSEMQLVNTLLGSITIAAGALNDLLGYILLALGSALAGEGKQLNALYQLLVALALFLLQWFVIRPFMFWMIRRSSFDLSGTGKQRVPEHLLAFTLVGALLSAFVTEACNLHPILGALLFGIACPHGNFAVMVTEEIETVAAQILLPLYFVNSGLKADFKLLNTGLIWGELFMVFGVVFISKFVTTTVCTRLAGFNWREASFVASLMQSKSIIELIILNAGREAGVLNAQVYSMLFVTFILSTLTVRPLATRIWRMQQESLHSKQMLSTSSGTSMIDEEEEKHSTSAGEIATTTREAATRRDVAILAALTSSNPAMEPLAALMQLASPGHGTNSVTFEFVRFLPNEGNSNAGILRQLHQHGDQVLDAVKLLALLKNVTRTEQDRKNELITITTAEDVIRNLKVRTDVVKGVSRKDDEKDGELGAQVVVVPWDKSAAFLAPAAGDTERAEHGTLATLASFGKATTMAGKIFDFLGGNNTSIGALVENSEAMFHLSCNGLDSRAVDVAQREADLGLSPNEERSGRPRKSRIIVPFFGGADDRACVELARRLRSNNDSADVIVVTVDDAAHGVLSDDVVKHLHAESKADEQRVEGNNLITVNLRSIDLEVERHADARALFGMRRERDVHTTSASTTAQASATRRTSVVRSTEGLVFVTLSAFDVQQTHTQTSLEAVLSFVRPLLLSQAGDMVFVGRGKWHQRMANFRVQLQAVQESQKVEQHALHALRNLGLVLGSSCEAALTYGLDANILVLQSGQAQTRKL